MEIKYFDISYLEALPTPRLLTYYKKTLPKIRKYQNSFFCECCGAPLYELYAKLYTKEEKEKRKADHKEAMRKTEQYLKDIKELLSKREHVPFKKPFEREK